MQRNPARIDPVIETLRQAWKRTPDQRLGQLVMNQVFHDPDLIAVLFNLEDDVMAQRLRAWRA